MQRRDFLQTSGMLALGALAPMTAAKGCGGQQRLDDIGVQLYTVRDQLGQDLAGTLKRVADIGYSYVEGFGYNEGQILGLTPAEFKKRLDDLGLRMPSCHTSLPAFRHNPELMLQSGKAAGATYVVLPWLTPNERNAETYAGLPKLLNDVGQTARGMGLKVGYHNHDFEFEPLPDGTLPLDLLMRETDPDLVVFELDLYWTRKAGQQPAEWFERYPDRFPLWHVKDMDDTPEQFFASVGSGTIDWPALFATRKQAGLRYFFVEQDQTRGESPLEAIADSYAYLKQMEY